MFAWVWFVVWLWELAATNGACLQQDHGSPYRNPRSEMTGSGQHPYNNI